MVEQARRTVPGALSNFQKGVDMATIEEIGTISKIEARTMSDVMNILKNHGLGKNHRKKMQDYITAKNICFEGMIISPHIFDRQIAWIVEYLKI